ncbi:MAG: 3-deoxy-D-manno-octulosonate 8-phosphate phosphatase [Thaumarchaeota archaeon]|jgi:YrbI family 3-deoxy-D-manno-octulosonate 8-phosphate phosphatase|nr:MAG: 3-deoxy-D-manno-octulosonate 8-phosphate phosphatase [Nitrososphaerota archaeon]
MKKNLSQKCKKIKLILTDVDGVLTDGGRYYSKTGEGFKKFHVRDGMGVNILLKNNIKTAIITKENSPIVKKWAKDMNVSKTYSGIIKKELSLKKICNDFSVFPVEVAFIGDDVNDLKLLNLIGLSSTPNDGIMLCKKSADYVCHMNGGFGAFRELSDLILNYQFPTKNNWY